MADVSELTVSCPRTHYSASAIARAVEDCDAHLLNLNVTADSHAAGNVVVELRFNHRSAGPVARSLERYGYEVVRTGCSGESDASDAMMRERVEQLLHYLEV